MELARRILDRHRQSARVKPLPASHVVLLRLSEPGRPEVSGRGEIAWARFLYRERIVSGGVAVTRGIQGDRAYFTDEDGVTRVGSEPMLRELLTRSFFWRRGYLFDDRERARLRLGPADEKTVSVALRPSGGNWVELHFSRADDRLVAVHSPGFELDFASPTSFEEHSRTDRRVAGQILWIGLPTGELEDAVAGGGTARFSDLAAEASMERGEDGIVVPAVIAGRPARLSIDGSRDGPVLLSPELAAGVGAPFQRDVFGRELAKGVPLAIGSLTWPGVVVERSSAALRGADAVAGGTVYRETVVEVDPEAARVRFHDPEQWSPPGGYRRLLLDDDGNRPVATLRRGSQAARVIAAAAGPPLDLAPEAARRLGLDPEALVARGLSWDSVQLPELPLTRTPGRFSPDWGDDGTLGFEVLLGYHVFLDMPHRWVYVRPIGH